MAIKKYLASKDNTITNAFKSNLTTRGTGSNMGQSDVSEVFSIFGQQSTSSLENSRILVEWDITSIQSDRSAGAIPNSGSVNFFLNLYNAKHSFTLPKNFTLSIQPLSRSWEEGYGLDMEEYTDLGYSNWEVASSSSSGLINWTTQGGDFHTGAYVAGSTLPSFSQYFDKGTEDLSVDITSLVEEWLDGTSDDARQNYGVGILLSGSQEDGSLERSFYTKKFFARGTEFFYKRPVIEARWDDSKKDNSGNFFLSSSLADAADNLNTLFLYNFVRGQLKDIPSVSSGEILLSVYSSLGGQKITLPVGSGVVSNDDVNVTGSRIETGIYSATFAYTGSATTIYPVWHDGTTEFHTGSAITVNSLSSLSYNPNPKYVSNITNLKPIYDTDENARFRLYIRQKDWSPTIYTKATSNIESEIIEDAYYKIFRIIDELDVIPYGTGSLNHTRLSYDVSGSYFDLDMNLLEPEYAYGIKFVYFVNGAYHEQKELFKFRVE
jgi:hypothetical protein